LKQQKKKKKKKKTTPMPTEATPTPTQMTTPALIARSDSTSSAAAEAPVQPSPPLPGRNRTIEEYISNATVRDRMLTEINISEDLSVSIIEHLPACLPVCLPACVPACLLPSLLSVCLLVAYHYALTLFAMKTYLPGIHQGYRGYKELKSKRSDFRRGDCPG